MSTYQASAALVVVVDGQPVHLDERYRRMVLWVLKLQCKMDSSRAGKLHLSYNGNSVAGALEQSYGPEWLEKAG